MPYRGHRLQGPASLPCFSTWFSPRDASLPSFGSQRAWFPALTGSMKALRLPTRVSAVTYFVRFHRPRDPPVFVSAVALLEELEVFSWPGRWVPVARSAGRFTWTPVGYLRSPGDPSCAFAPLLDPGRTDVPLPWRSHRYCPRFVRQRRLRTMRISGLTHAASAPALLRFAFRVATHAQGWLPAGWLAFTGRASNPLDHYERFQFTWSSPFPVLLTLLTFHTGARSRFAPPTCRMPLGLSQASPKLIPKDGPTLGFDIV